MDNRNGGNRSTRSNRRGQMSPEQAARRREMAQRREKQRRRRNLLRIAGVVVVLALFAGALVLLFRTVFGGDNSVADSPSLPPTTLPAGTDSAGGLSVLPDNSDKMQTPQAVADTDVSKLGIQKQLMVDGQEVEEYTRPEQINFGGPGEYTDLKGIVTFRGNNYRDSAVYGNATNVSEKKLHIKWMKETGSLGTWTGNGWVGQPLIVEWPEATRRIMNLHDEKKNKDGLVEVIYAGMDGKIHFYDLDDGSPTRDDINIGQPFKGSGALDPRGIPMIFLGGGDDVNGVPSSAVIYSLVDGSKLHDFGRNDSFSTRSFTAWDSSALVSAETDILIYPGENGILYTMKLNTQFDKETGALSIKPGEEVKMRYTNARHREELEKTGNAATAKYWIGMESSPVVWKNYLYIADNCGDLLCIDLNSMKVIWAQDTLDDTNCSPVLDIEADGKGYIYISTSLNWTKDANDHGKLGMWKIDATTGEKVLTFDYECYTISQPKVSGGVQATALLGRNSIDDLLIFPVARWPKPSYGMLYALDKNTFEERWSYEFVTETANGGYTWSSPIAIYDENGEAYIIVGNADGFMFLFDKAGNLLDKLELQGSVEASPAAFGNTLVVGTRGRETYAIELR